MNEFVIKGLLGDLPSLIGARLPIFGFARFGLLFVHALVTKIVRHGSKGTTPKIKRDH
ncbi:MAG: hypothetical protein QOJ84_4216 [Bradyrhizobium sp.]|jgi:hypothetical protein|nr:hypothetical protein [Bradyrhizobium sp.]